MALPLNGPISLSMIQAEFGGSSPVRLSDYYRVGMYVPDIPANANVPTSGPISMSNFYGASNSPPNNPPIWVTGWNLGTHTSFNPINIQLNAYDPEGGPITYSDNGGMPSWLSVTSAGLLHGTAPQESDPVGQTYGFSIMATDNQGAGTPKTFNISIQPAQAAWFTPAYTLDVAQNPSVPSSIYFYYTDPNNNAHIEQTPGYSLPPVTALYDEVPDGTPPNLKGVTLRGIISSAGTYYVYLDLVTPIARTTRMFTLNVTISSGGGTGGGGSEGGGSGENTHN